MTWPLLIPLALAIALAVMFAWRRRAEPDGWSLGPIIKGRNRSRGRLTLGRILGEEGLWSLDGGEPHYVTRSAYDLSLGARIRLRYRVEGTMRPVEKPSADPLLTLYFQREGDDWSARGPKRHYRWYSKARLPLAPGDYEAFVDVEPRDWFSVLGEPGEDNPRIFERAVREAVRVGVVLGWQGRAGHGVTLDGRFTMLQFAIEPALNPDQETVR